jgi:methionyl-tRNA formyltransferase
MRIVFVGRANFANHCFANWLAERHEVCAYLLADIRRYTTSYRWKWFRRQIRRKGLRRAIDLALYQLFYRLTLHRRDHDLLAQVFEEEFGRAYFQLPPEMPRHEFEDLNSEPCLAVLRDLAPDVVLTVCVTQYLKRPYMEIPRLGTLLYHEGLTPEYKGLHTPFWANYNNEADRIGYTLLQLTPEIDAGPPLAQGVGDIDPQYAHWPAYAGHKALMDGLPDLAGALAALERGETPHVQRDFGPACSYSYPGITDELTRRRLRRQRAV